MHVPQHFAMADADVAAVLREPGAGELITATPKGLLATLLPLLHDPDAGPRGALLGHLARSNEQWRQPCVGEAMVLLRGPDAYVSPAWYPSKAEHGRVVPTWNYVRVHVYGALVVHDDPGWLADLVDRLTRQHEAHRDAPWSTADAPPRFVEGQLRAVVGVELQITRVEAKAKLSQNRPDADIDGVVRGTLADGATAMSRAVEAARPRRDRGAAERA